MRSVRAAAAVGRVIVVDNTSDDGSVSAAHAAGADVVVENGSNLGFARAVNTGLKGSTADLVLLLNPDAELGPKSLASMCGTLHREPGAVIVAPLLRGAGGAVTAGAGRFATLPRRVGLCVPVVGRARYFSPQYHLCPAALSAGAALEVDYVYGAAMLIDGAFLRQASGLDERFFLFAEDEDICRQARAAGRRVLLDTRAVAAHVGGASCGDEALTEAQRLYSTYLLFDKWRGSRAAAAYHAGIVSASWLRVGEARAGRRPDAAVDIARMSAAFDDAVRRGVQPLLATRPAAAPPAADSVGAGTTADDHGACR